MKQTITIPERTLEHVVSEIHMNIFDPTSVKGRVIVGKRAVGDTTTPQYLPIPVNVTNTLSEALAKGDITAANIAGFKKCLKSIIAKALEIDISIMNEPL